MEERARRKLDKALREHCAKRKRTPADEHEITEYALERLEEVPGLKLFGPEAQHKGGVASFTLDAADPRQGRMIERIRRGWLGGLSLGYYPYGTADDIQPGLLLQPNGEAHQIIQRRAKPLRRQRILRRQQIAHPPGQLVDAGVDARRADGLVELTAKSADVLVELTAKSPDVLVEPTANCANFVVELAA